MANAAHRSKQRRAERGPLTEASGLNLVPLVDILTSVVFFSLLTYQGATMAALTAYDLQLPPAVVTEAGAGKNQERQTLLLAVKLVPQGYQVEHSEEGGFKQVVAGRNTPQSLSQLEQLMRQIRQKYPQNADVLVVPNDDVSYDEVIEVLERLKMAAYTGISLGSQARAERVASAGN